MKENSNADCVMNVKNAEISNEPGQNLSGFRFIQTLPKIINLNFLGK